MKEVDFKYSKKRVTQRWAITPTQPINPSAYMKGNGLIKVRTNFVQKMHQEDFGQHLKQSTMRLQILCCAGGTSFPLTIAKGLP